MSIYELYQLINRKKPSVKSAPEVVFTLCKGIAGFLELAQKDKVVKNLKKKKKEFRGAF